MVLIVAGHFFGQSGFFNYASGGDYWFAIFFGSASRIAVNIFLLLGVWFMVDSKFKAKRVLKLYFNVWILTVPITVVIIILGFHPGIKDVVRGFFPFVSEAVWFATAYLVLIILSPWLHRIIAWPQNRFKLFLVLCTLFIPIWITFFTLGRSYYWLEKIGWFCYVYIFMGYYKHYMRYTIPHAPVLFIGILLYIAISAASGYCNLHIADSNYMKLGQKITTAILIDYKTIPNFFIAMCIFYFFQNIKIEHNKIINYIATGAFTTYVIHQTPAFIQILWHNIYQCDYYLQTEYRSIFALSVIISVYAICLAVERVRRKFIEPLFLDFKVIKNLEQKIDTAFKCIE